MAEERAKRKLSAILSADVKGYSRLMRDDELSTVRTLEAHREVMTAIIKKYRGRVVDSPGDNLLAEFASVVDAVESAVEIQKELKEKNAELPEKRRMEFRVGVNLGDVIEEGERIYGDGVNIAARVEGLAEGGGISVSGTVFEHVKEKLSLGYAYQGEQTVKNIPEPVKIYRVLMEPEAAGKVIGEVRLKPRRWSWAAVLVVIVLAVGALTFWNFYLRPQIEPASLERMAHPLPDKPSVAVLPFENLTGEPDQEYFSDGITEEIITALSKTPKLFVIARNSTFTYKGKPVKVQQVAEELGVQYILEGSVRKAGDKIRITAQLIDALTGHHLWAERYDRELKDIFAVQDDITMNILKALQIKLAYGETARTGGKGTKNIDAFIRFLNGTYYLRQWNREANAQARQLAKEAIALDPNYPSGYRLLGWTHLFDVYLGWTKSPKQSMAQAFEAAQKALRIDESFAPAHGLLGNIYLSKRQYDEAIAECELALELQPNSAPNHAYLARVLHFAGRQEEALALFKKAIRLDPKPPTWFTIGLGSCYQYMGKYVEAVEVFKKLLRNNPNDLMTNIRLSAGYVQLGREEEARAIATEVLRLKPEFSVEFVAKRWPYKNKADVDILVNALRKAGLPENPPLPLPDKPSIAVLPFVNMSEDPEQEYFSDGITEEIITALSKTPKLFVIARNSTFTYKGKSVKVQQVGRELGVKYVLEGSVRKAKDKVRVTAQLVDAKTGHHLWADRYDRELKDIFAVQDEITMKIITAMGVNLTAGEQARLSAKGTDNLDAYLKYLEGREHVFRFNKDDNLLARQRAEEAMALDPEYSNAYALLGKTHILDVWFKWSKSPKESLARAFELAEKALVLDASNIGAHRVLSHIYLLKRQHDKAIVESERAVSFAPNAADEIFNLGVILRFSGRAKEAISMHERAIRLNPMPPASYLYQLGLCYTFIGEFEKAIDISKKALHQNPDDLVGRVTLAIAYSSLGREEEARAEAAEVLRIHPKFSVEYASKTWPYKNQADRDLVMNALRKAGLK